jgi:hypothetical protein
MYLAANRLPYDTNAADFKDLGNRSIADYVLNVDIPRGTQDLDRLNRNERLDHPNLHLNLGYGTADASVMDVDSSLRLDSSSTRTRTKLSLNSTRDFVANPNMNKQIIDYASKVNDASNKNDVRLVPTTSCDRSCKTLTEANFGSYTFAPLIKEMREFIDKDVPLDFYAIGSNSRDSFRKERHHQGRNN